MAIQLTSSTRYVILAVIFSCSTPSQGYCGPSQLISKIFATANGFRTECGRPYPICVHDCKWTNYTCAAFEKQQRLTKNTVALSNVTKRGSNNIERKCCKSSRMNISTCHTVQWPVDDLFKYTTSHAFSIQQFADAHCPSRLAFVRDITRNKATNLALELCCFTYKDARMICRSTGGPVANDAALIAAALPLSLALGIGIPLYFTECRRQFNILQDTDAVCGPNGIEKTILTTNEECCQICARTPDRTFCMYDTIVKKCYVRKCSNGYNFFPADGCISYVPK